MSPFQRIAGTICVIAAGSGPIAAQVAPLTPFSNTLDLLVVDSSFDGVWRKTDRNQDGDYNDVGEVSVYYDDATGAISLTNPNCIAIGQCGTAFVGDSTVDVIMALDDIDGDGNANAAGEHRVFFDASNVGGIVMASVQGLTVDATGAVFAAVSNSGSSGDDMILRMFDANQDGDANDSGEASVYCLIPNGSGSVGNSIPTDVRAAVDGNLYYTEVGATGTITKGVYKLEDTNFDGDCNDPGEWSLFWAPPAAGNAFYWGLAIEPTLTFYVTDHGNEQVWRGSDVNGDGVISGPIEENVFYQTGNSTWWDVLIRSDGSIFLCEDQTPDRITALRDLNGDFDALDAGESFEAYSDTVSATATRPRGAAFMRAPSLIVAPTAVSPGQTTSLAVTTGRAGDLVAILLSNQLATPTPVPPFGQIEVNPLVLVTLIGGTADSACSFGTQLTIPNDPGQSGQSFALQAIAGNAFQLQFAGAAPLVIQ